MGEVHIARRIVSVGLFILRSLQMIRRDRCRALDWVRFAFFGYPLHTYPAQALRGGRALGLIAVRVRPPNGLSRIFQGSLESLYGATFNPPLRCLARRYPMKQRYSYPLSTGVMRSISNCFRRLHLSLEAYWRSRPYGSSLPSQYNASCAGRKIKERLRGAQASF